jgi:hypothetical protein
MVGLLLGGGRGLELGPPLVVAREHRHEAGIKRGRLGQGSTGRPGAGAGFVAAKTSAFQVGFLPMLNGHHAVRRFAGRTAAHTLSIKLLRQDEDGWSCASPWS